MNFRKLPVEVEVEEQVEEVREIDTAGGFIEAEPGDVIVRDVHGKRYAFPADLFAKTHVPADPEDETAWSFYDDVLPEGVEVISESTNGTKIPVHVTGVKVVGRDELDREAWERAVEFKRNLLAVLEFSTPPARGEEKEEEDSSE